MDTTSAARATRSLRPDLMEVAHILVLVQGAILVASTVEAVFFLAFAGAAAGVSLALTAGAAVLTLATAAGLARGSRRARRWTLLAESGVLAFGLLDLVLALLMTGEAPPPVPLLAGLVVPAGVIAILRRR